MKFRTRVLALGLSVFMVLSSVPQTAYASELTNQEVSTDITADSTAEAEKSETTVNDTVETQEPVEATEEPQDELEVVEESIESDAEAELNQAAKEYLFKVTEDGTLAFADGKTESNIKATVNLTELTDPAGGVIKKIPANIFAKNITITSIVIPSTVEEFGEAAFQKCTNLSKVTFENNEIAAKKLSKELFYGCNKLALSENGDFYVPAGVEEISSRCFEGCSGLYNLNLTYATSLKVIGESAFADCSKLEQIRGTSKSPVEKIDDNAFKNCKSLGNDLDLPTTVSSIGAYVFSNCTKLTKLDLTKLDGSKLEKVDGLAKYCFAESKLEGVILPSDYTVIQPFVFGNCTSLKTFKDLNGKLNIKTIETDAFIGCSALEAVELPASIETVKNYAFRDCTKVKTIKVHQGKAGFEGATVNLFNHSFPVNNGLTIYGYGGTVEEWAGKHDSEGVKFQTLYTNLKFKCTEAWEKNTITARGVKLKEVETSSSTAGNVKVDGQDAKKDENDKYETVENVTIGTLAEVTAVPATGYSLVSLTHGPSSAFVDTETKVFTVSGEDLNKDGEIQVDAAFAKVSSASDFELRADDSDYTVSKDSSGYILKTEGEVVPLNIVAKTDHYGNVASNPTLWTFASSDKNFATISAAGKIFPKRTTEGTKNGYITISATLKSNTKIVLKLRLSITGTQIFKQVTDFTIPDSSKYTHDTIDAVTGEPVVLINKAWVKAATSAGSTIDINVSVNAVDTAGKKIDSSYNWKTTNSNVVKLEAEKSSTRDNVVKICGVGEATVTATRPEEKNKDSGKVEVPEQKLSFIVRVVDPTPYIAQSTIVVNSNANIKAPSGDKFNGKFELIQAYNGNITSEDLAIVVKTNGTWKNQEKNFDLELGESSTLNGAVVQTVYLKIPTDSALDGKNSTLTNLYIRTTIAGDNYYTAIPKLVVTTRQPNPTAKITGKINTFYKATPNTRDYTYVECAISEVAGYSFDTTNTDPDTKLQLKTAKVEGATGYDNDEYFVDNFTVEPKVEGDYSKLIIRQKAATLKVNSKGKPVVTGYICVPYTDGTVANIKVTIPYSEVKPVYALSATSVTTHSLESKQKFEIKLIDKTATAAARKKDKTATVYVDLTNAHSASCTLGKPDIQPKVNAETDTIEATMPVVISGNIIKTNIEITSSDWNNRILAYPYSIKIVTKQPVVKASSTKIALNTDGTNSNSIDVAFKEVYMQQLNCLSIESRETKDARILEANKISCRYSNGKIIASFDTANAPTKGTYAFKMNYIGVYKGGSTFPAPASLNFSVVVDGKAKRTVTVKSAVKLNDFFCGVVDADGKPVEVATAAFVYKNIAAGSSTTVDLTNAKLINISKAKEPITYTYDAETKGFVYVSGENKIKAPITIALTDGKLSVYFNTRLAGNKKCKIEDATVDGIKVQPITFNISSISKDPVVTVSGKNSINVLDPSTYVDGTIKITNFSGTIDPSKLSIISEYKAAAKNSPATNYAKENFHFAIADNNTAANKFKVVLNSTGNNLEMISYTLGFKYSFGTKDGSAVTKETNKIRTTPTQKNPLVSVTPSKTVLYSRNTAFTRTVVVESKSENIAIEGVKWSSKSSDTIKNGFADPVYDKATGKITIKIKNSAVLRKDTTYKLYLETSNGTNQAKNVAGREFVVEVTVK